MTENKTLENSRAHLKALSFLIILVNHVKKKRKLQFFYPWLQLFIVNINIDLKPTPNKYVTHYTEANLSGNAD